MSITLCTFNINNLFLRYRFEERPPGSKSKKASSNDKFFFLPAASKASYELFNETQRKLAAMAIRRGGKGPASYPDILCLQEVECMMALHKFNERYLDNIYKYLVVIDSHDDRLIDVGIMSRLPIVSLRTHIDDRTKNNKYVFSRDCLEAEINLQRSDLKSLTILINHFKSKIVTGETEAERKKNKIEADNRRKNQALAVHDIIKTRWPGNRFNDELFAVVGDLNDEPESDPVQPIVTQAGLFNVLDRITIDEERWTCYYSGDKTVSQLDHMLLSPALKELTKDCIPEIERRGITTKSMGKTSKKPLLFKRIDNDPNPKEVNSDFPRFKDVDNENYASDHCPIFLEIP